MFVNHAQDDDRDILVCAFFFYLHKVTFTTVHRVDLAVAAVLRCSSPIGMPISWASFWGGATANTSKKIYFISQPQGTGLSETYD